MDSVEHGVKCMAKRQADHANEILREELEKASVVWGHIGTHASSWSSHPPGTFVQENNTHTARLVAIKEIKK
jgi:hypothetical protein